MEFSRQEYWSRLLFPTLRDLTDPGIKPVSPTLAGWILYRSATGETQRHIRGQCFCFWLSHVTYRILVTLLRIEPELWQWTLLSPNHWTAREFLETVFITDFSLRLMSLWYWILLSWASWPPLLMVHWLCFIIMGNHRLGGWWGGLCVNALCTQKWLQWRAKLRLRR